mmetsp:Transcript_3114/g.9014  ORF Transcript_3114/g.9014 Transcript_3114/m.9014 type:complete len:259 (+) Transcript_3114:1767-2543(+)
MVGPSDVASSGECGSGRDSRRRFSFELDPPLGVTPRDPAALSMLLRPTLLPAPPAASAPNTDGSWGKLAEAGTPLAPGGLSRAGMTSGGCCGEPTSWLPAFKPCLGVLGAFLGVFLVGLGLLAMLGLFILDCLGLLTLGLFTLGCLGAFVGEGFGVAGVLCGCSRAGRCSTAGRSGDRWAPAGSLPTGGAQYMSGSSQSSLTDRCGGGASGGDFGGGLDRPPPSLRPGFCPAGSLSWRAFIWNTSGARPRTCWGRWAG